MKKILFPLVLILFVFTGLSYSQLKIGYVDSKTILSKLPDAQDARQKLDGMIRDWQNELKKMEGSKKLKEDDFDRRKLIMTEQTRTELHDEIKKLDQQISDYRDKKFGTNGELFQKQEELMKPVQNKVFNAIQDVAKDENLDFVFDRSGQILLLFAKDKYDITPLVMDKLKLQQ
ncbi:MAG: OmpH family outer membrane protein [Bacteroidetes bacterium]|nr:OmpH family outer membrane protein [Bacteroidota bacterium]